jgi:uncharacterized membrane protein HdeD (DUF308 family)
MQRQAVIRGLVLLGIASIGAGLLFFVEGPTIVASRLTHRVWDLGHLGLFGTLTALSFWALRDRCRKWRPWSIHCTVLGTVLVVGAVTEWVQAMVGREASWEDVGRNLVGAFLISAFFNPALPPLTRSLRHGLQAAALASLLWAVVPVMRTSYDEYQRYQQFPTLSDFTTRFERDRWVATYGSNAEINTDLMGQTGRKSLKVYLGSDLYSGIILSSPFRDFGQYERLHFRILNTATHALDMTCRINDLAHNNEWNDRFSRPFDLQPGWNTLTFTVDEIRRAPRDREMKMSQVRVLMLFRPQPSPQETIYIDKVWLD